MGFLTRIFGRGDGSTQKRSAPNPAAKMARTMGSSVGDQQAAGTGRLEQNWQTWPTTPDALIYKNWRTLVARSRMEVENNDHARKFIQMVRENVAGPTGFELQASIKDPNGTPDIQAAKAVEAAFDAFSERGIYEITGSMSRADVERLVISTVAIDGEVFAIKVRGDDAPDGFCIQLVDPMLVHPQHFEKLDNGNAIRHGIEFSPAGRPVAYYFQEYDERQIGYVQMTWRTAKRIPAADVIHVFIPERVGQKRGMPWMRTALWRLRMLGGFEDSAVVNARVGASKMGFFRDPNMDPDPDQEPFQMDAEPGVFEDIGTKEFVAFNPQFPSENFAPFVTAMLRSISAGLGVSYNNLANDLTGVNFSSIRQGALDEREVWKGIQQWFVSAWCKPVFNAWIERALLANKITVAGKPLKFERLDKYKSVSWQGRRWGWIDPQAEVAAQVMAINANLTSKTAIIRENGNDREDIFDEIAQEKKEEARLKIEPILAPGTAIPGKEEPNGKQEKPKPDPAKD